MRVPAAMASPVVRIVGVVLVVAAVALGIALIFVDTSDDPVASEQAPLPESVDLGDFVLEPVGWAPGATALAAIDGDVAATDVANGARFEVVDPGAESPTLADAVPFGSVSRLDRAESAPGAGDAWVAEGDELLRLDGAGEVVETVLLEHPASVVAITDDAVWLTVSGIPVPDESGIVAPRSVLQRVDLETGEVLAVPVDDPVSFNLAVVDDAVWATVGSTLLRLDPTTVEPRFEVALEGPATALLPDGGAGVLVVVGGEPPSIVRVDAEGVAGTPIQLEEGVVGEAVVVDGADGDEVWVLRPDDDRVDRVGLDTGEVDSFEIVSPRRIELTDDGVWLLGGADDGLVLVARRS